MSKIAFVFPGQGAQAVGMGADVFSTIGAQKLAEADELLGYGLSELILDGPEDQLKLTYHTQPALLLTSIAYLEALSSKGIKPDYVAGHSLGEYSALVAADVLSFADALQTVRARGLFMEEAVPAGEGAMAAVIGAKSEALETLCNEITAEGTAVQLANLNCPGQIVISGTAAGVDKVVARGKEVGARRVIPLDVSGPFHSTLMEPAANQLAEVLDKLSFRNARVPVITNVTAKPETNGETLKRLLVEQVCAPVLWEQSVQTLIEQGVDTFYEIGSGTVLAGLIKKIDRSVRVISINSLEAIEGL